MLTVLYQPAPHTLLVIWQAVFIFLIGAGPSLIQIISSVEKVWWTKVFFVSFFYSCRRKSFIFNAEYQYKTKVIWSMHHIFFTSLLILNQLPYVSKVNYCNGLNPENKKIVSRNDFTKTCSKNVHRKGNRDKFYARRLSEHKNQRHLLREKLSEFRAHNCEVLWGGEATASRLDSFILERGTGKSQHELY